MSYTALNLITNAYYTSGIVGRNLQTITGAQEADGFFLLNEFLAMETADNRLIPYYSNYEMALIVGQEMYYIPNLISIEVQTFNLADVRFPMTELSRREYFGQPRVNNIQSLPFTYHLERTFGGSNLWIYYLPDNTYPLNFVGKFSLASVTLFQDLSLTLDEFYLGYLRYALASQICDYNDVQFKPANMARLLQYKQIILDTSPIDLTTNVMPAFPDRGSALNYGYVNFPGYSPAGY